MDRYALICRNLLEHSEITQRELAQAIDMSLGTVNRLVKECAERQLITVLEDGHYEVTEQGKVLLEHYRVDGAIIIAAGFGSRFVPLTFETPKGLLEVFGERMIERQIKQLHEVGITDITIVVGYLKEKFEYLIDKYGVKLLYNGEYSSKNTLATIYHARKALNGRNMYLLASDNWMRENMYHTYECASWYSSVFQEGDTSEWCLSFNKKGKITNVEIGGRDSWVMYGPAFFSKEWSKYFISVLEAYYTLPGTEPFFWETVLLEMVNGTAQKRLMEEGIQELGGIPFKQFWEEVNQQEFFINRQACDQVYEFENLEELRRFDSKYQNHSDNEAMELVADVFQVPESNIHNIKCLKAGMTNKSFLFSVSDKQYICRIPGPGTELLINRKQEAAVYEAVKPLGITEHVIYFNGENGYKISEYYEGARNSNAQDWADVSQCMKLLRNVHQAGLKVEHRFDIRERIAFYEQLCKNYGAIPFEDYFEIKARMDKLMDFLESLKRPETLSHIDSVADNFLFLPDNSLKLIDWEYSGMCDPLIDIAMCSIYSYYNEEQTDQLIKIYLGRCPDAEEQAVVYSYIALGGFLWSLWAVYKSFLGEEFGEYTLSIYRYAKNYYQRACRIDRYNILLIV